MDLPLYVEDWIDQINYNNPNDKPGNYPVHRYDVDGGYLYIPISGMDQSRTPRPIAVPVTGSGHSAYNTGSILTVDRFTHDLERTLDMLPRRKRRRSASRRWTRPSWSGGKPAGRRAPTSRYYFYPAADGNGCWTVSGPSGRIWASATIPDIFIEPQVMYLMAESFTPVEDFTPAAGNSTRTERTSTQIVPVGKSSAEITVGYTTQQGPDGEVIDPSAGIYLKNVAKVNNISRVGAVEQDQIVYLNDGKTAIVPRELYRRTE